MVRRPLPFKCRQKCENGGPQEFKCASASASRGNVALAPAVNVKQVCAKRQFQERAFAILRGEFCPGPCSYTVVEPSPDSYSAFGLTAPQHQPAASTCARQSSLRLTAKFSRSSPWSSHAEFTSSLRSNQQPTLPQPLAPGAVPPRRQGSVLTKVFSQCVPAARLHTNSVVQLAGATGNSLCSGAYSCYS